MNQDTATQLRDLLLRDLPDVIASLFLAALQALILIFVRHRVIYCKVEDAHVEFGNQQINTQTIAIQNVGWRDAKEICVLHNWRTGGWGFDVEPRRFLWSFIDMPNGQVAFSIKHLPRGETIYITYNYYTPPGGGCVLNSISIEGRAVPEVGFPLARIRGKWLRIYLYAQVFIGSLVFVYAILKGAAAAWRYFVH